MADEVGLRDWVVHMVYKPLKKTDKRGATSECIWGQKQVNIRLRVDFFEGLNQQHQKETGLHELIHVHVNPVNNVIRRWPNFERVLGHKAMGLLHDHLTEQVEYIVDGLAVELARRFPTPEEWADGQEQEPTPPPVQEAQEAGARR